MALTINILGVETGIFLKSFVNTPTFDALDACVARTPVAIVLGISNKLVPFLSKENFNHELRNDRK